MADIPSEQVQTQTQPQPARLDPNSLPYWCYLCIKQVSIETSADLPDIICHECKNGFVEPLDSQQPPDPIDDLYVGNQLLQILRFITQGGLDDNAPPPLPSEHTDPSGDDYFRIALDWSDNDDDGEEEEEEDDDDENQSVTRNEDDENQGREHENPDRSEDEDEEEEEDDDENRQGRDEDALRQRQGTYPQFRLRDFAPWAANRRNRILELVVFLRRLVDQWIEADENPGDYLDAAVYAALLQNLAENDIITN